MTETKRSHRWWVALLGLGLGLLPWHVVAGWCASPTTPSPRAAPASPRAAPASPRTTASAPRPARQVPSKAKAPTARRVPSKASTDTSEEALPWRLGTSVPLYLTGAGGLVLTTIGLFGNLSQPEQQNTPTPQPPTTELPLVSPWGVLFFGGLSVMASSVSAALWRANPSTWMGVLGSVLTGSIAVASPLLIALGPDQLTVSMGWGLLLSLPIHIALNVVGWFNIRHHQIVREREAKERAAGVAPSLVRVQIAPAVLPHGAGFQIVGQF